MRRAPAIALLVPAVGLASCVTSSSKHPEQVQTTSQAERENIQGAASAPLRDMNVLRTKIPQVLLEAMADPYYRPPGKLTCDDIINFLKPINDALGDDLDVPKAKEAMKDRGESAAFGAMAGAASDAVPFHSWIRRLSGAERHDKLVQQAVTAGGVRRGYLKGLGEAKSCPPPAVPSHVKTGSKVMSQEIKVRFPTRLHHIGSGSHSETPPDDPPR